MAVTINVNGLSLVHEASEGVSKATLPNVCDTPGAGAVLYPNTAFSKDLAAGTRGVRVDGDRSAAVLGSRFETSIGDEAGTLGGVVSRTHGAAATWLTHSFDVRIEGRPACRLTDKMIHNDGNTVDCAGETQPVVKKGGTEVDLRRVHTEFTGPYSLEVTVVAQQGTKKQRVEDARVRVTATDRKRDRREAEVHFGKEEKPLPGRSWEGDTKPGGRGGGQVGKCRFKGLAKRRYAVEVFHDCYAEAPANKGTVFVDAKPRKYKADMVTGHLRTVANAKNVRIGARADTLEGRESDTFKAEMNEIIEGTFFASRCGDRYYFSYPNDFVDMNQNLTDLSRRPDGTFTQTPGFDFAPSQEIVDYANANGKGLGWNSANALHQYAIAAGLTVQATPLIWPAPGNTPAWPNGTVGTPGGYVDRRAAALAGAGMPAADATRTAVREVLEAFIVGIMGPRSALGVVQSYVVVNEVLNMRYHGSQENATAEKDYARAHPFWRKFGMWDVEDKYRNDKDDYKALWENVRWCFETAHKTDKAALLILNDFNVEYVPKKWSRKELEAATERELVGPRRKRDEKIDKAKDRFERGRSKVRKRWEAAEDRERPRSPRGAATAFRDALVDAGKEFDGAMLGAHGAYERDTKQAEDRSHGRPVQEKKYEGEIAKAQQAYADKLVLAKTKYGQRLTEAEALFTQRRTAEVAAKGAPADKDVVHANEAQRDYTKKRHTAAEARFASLHAHARRFAKSVHAATRTFGKLKASAGGRRDAQVARWEKPELFYDLARWLTKVLSPDARKRLAIGFQMHHPDHYLDKGYSPKAIAKCVRRFAKLDLPVVVTELDVDVESTSVIVNGAERDKWRKKRDRYKRRLERWSDADRRTRGPKPKKPTEPKPVYLKDVHALALAGVATDADRQKAERDFYTKHRKIFSPAFREQAERTRRMIEALLSARNCISINTWGVGDRPTSFRYAAYWFHWGWPCPTKNCLTHDNPALLDKKPSYVSSVAAFLNAKKQYTEGEIRQGAARKWAQKLDRRER